MILRGFTSSDAFQEHMSQDRNEMVKIKMNGYWL